MEEFTLLTKEQLYGEKALEVIKKYGRKAIATDFAILFAAVTNKTKLNELKSRIGNYWFLSNDANQSCIVLENGDFSFIEPNKVGRCGRPIILKPDKSKILIKSDINGILEVEYNSYEYPQTVVEKPLFVKLERMYNNGDLNKTGKSYASSNFGKDKEINKVIDENPEYEYNGEKYVRVKASFLWGENPALSNNCKYKDGDFVWVKVEPIKWLLDESTDILISEKLLFSGIEYNYKDTIFLPCFEETKMYKFISKYFARDIVSKNSIVEVNKKEEKRLSSNLSFSPLNTDEIMINAIKNKIPLLLHGKSSSCKVEKIKQLDPNCVIVDLKSINEAALIGLVNSDFEKKETMFINPWWYNEICEICKKEPEKIHILYFDEFTNSSSQSNLEKLAAGIILNRKFINSAYESHLPDNCGIVASTTSSGKERFDDSSIYEFIHIQMDQPTNDWIKWALREFSNNNILTEEINDNLLPNEHKIHPLICAYIAYRGDSVLQVTNYKEWELASKMLYKTKNICAIETVIESDFLCKDFYSFCNRNVISIKDVLEGKYIKFMNLAEKYLTVYVLSEVNEENVEIVRDYIKEFGEEFENLFDSIWTYGNKERLEIIKNLKETQNVHSLNN